MSRSGGRRHLNVGFSVLIVPSCRTSGLPAAVGAKLGAIPCGLVWTAMDAAESKACRFGLCGRVWTPVDTAWRSTEQKVGGRTLRVRRVTSGRATETLDQQGDDARHHPTQPDMGGQDSRHVPRRRSVSG